MAGRIPRVFINDLLARTDIVDLIDARVKLKKQGKNFHACCPFHNEKTPSFTVNGETVLPLLWMWRARQRDRLPDELRQARVR